jgi:hypothetical protein
MLNGRITNLPFRKRNYGDTHGISAFGSSGGRRGHSGGAVYIWKGGRIKLLGILRGMFPKVNEDGDILKRISDFSDAVIIPLKEFQEGYIEYYSTQDAMEIDFPSAHLPSTLHQG